MESSLDQVCFFYSFQNLHSIERHGIVASWRYGVVALWRYGVMVLWCYGAMVLWCCGAVVLWTSGFGGEPTWQLPGPANGSGTD